MAKEQKSVLDKEPEIQEKPKADEKLQATWDKDVLLKIFDDILFSNGYTEEVTLKKRLKVTFRTRTTEETLNISKSLDSSQLNLVSTVNEQRAFQNVLSSLIAFQGKDLVNTKSEDKEKFVRNLPTPVMSLLVDALADFDAKVNAACKEGEESF